MPFIFLVYDPLTLFHKEAPLPIYKLTFAANLPNYFYAAVTNKNNFTAMTNCPTHTLCSL